MKFCSIVIIPIFAILKCNAEIVRFEGQGTNSPSYTVLDTRPAEGGVVWTWDNIGTANQRWSVNLAEAMSEKCATFTPVAQDGGRIKVLEEELRHNTVAVWGKTNLLNQDWCLKKAAVYWQIQNKWTGRCLVNKGFAVPVVTEPCYEYYLVKDQLWNIYIHG